MHNVMISSSSECSIIFLSRFFSTHNPPQHSFVNVQNFLNNLFFEIKRMVTYPPIYVNYISSNLRLISTLLFNSSLLCLQLQVLFVINVKEIESHFVEHQSVRNNASTLSYIYYSVAAWCCQAYYHKPVIPLLS